MMCWLYLNIVVVLISNIGGFILSDSDDKQCSFKFYNTTEMDTPHPGKYIVMTPNISPLYSSHLTIDSGYDYCLMSCGQSVLTNGNRCWAITYDTPNNCTMYYFTQPPTVVYSMAAGHTSDPVVVSFYLRECQSNAPNSTMSPGIASSLTPPTITSTGNGSATLVPPQILTNTSYLQQGGAKPTTAPSDMCYHINHYFNLGDYWMEGCRYKCQCYNTSTNTKLCNDMCPRYDDLPEGCVLSQNADECCPVVKCSTNGTSLHNNNTGCGDRLQYCDFYEDSACVGVYEPWARANCALRCGFCNYTAPCLDRITYCGIYEIDYACSSFPGWARYYCKRSCGMCT